MTDANPVREEAVIRAHAWCVRMWNERKISAEFTSADEAELVEMMLGLLMVFPPPQRVEGDMFARGEMASSPASPGIEPVPTNSELQDALAIFSRLQSEHSDLIERERVLEAEVTDLRRQVVEEKAQREQAQDSAAVAWAKAAASPALIEEYARACHYAGSSGLAIVDWPQWLSRRAARR